MSLIYQALRHMQAQQAPTPALVLRPATAVRRRRYLSWTLRLGLPLGVLTTLASAWALSPAQQQPPQRERPAVAVAAVTTPAATDQPRATPVQPATATPDNAPATTPTVPTHSDIRATKNRGVTVVDTPAPPALPPGALVRHERHGKAAKDDDAQVQQAIARLNAAIAQGRYADARRDLDMVSARLPPDSLTLLRMRAWYAAQSGNGDPESLYRQILYRLPDDQNAGVNLALIRARAGDYAGARKLLDRAKTRDPESPVVREALRTIEALQP
jgi:tetratricopeptide (TPR) repeat protein